MTGHFRVALMSVSGLILWGCSTQPSKPTNIVTRDVTAVCPVSEPIFDRSFASPPPACVNGLTIFRFDESGKWIEAIADGTGQIKTQEECLRQVSEWIDAEGVARGHGGPRL